MAGPPLSSLPLEGITVVSVEQAVAAPLASCRLADAGARVIKVERPGGDFARGYDVAANGVSSYFAWLNRGKESVVLDLTDDHDRSLLADLIAESDVFIQNLSAGTAARLGFGAEVLRERRPHLIVCDITGYGDAGPMADAKAYDLLVQAESGLLSVSGPPGPPGRIGVSVVDIGTGLNAASAILAALYRRQRTGEGAHLRVSLFDSIAEWMTVPLLHHDYLGSAPERIGLAHPSIAPYGGFELADGSVVLISIQSDREWRALCDVVLLRPELGTDPDHATNVARRAQPGADRRDRCSSARGPQRWRRAGRAGLRENRLLEAQRRRRPLDAPASAAGQRSPTPVGWSSYPLHPSAPIGSGSERSLRSTSMGPRSAPPSNRRSSVDDRYNG